MKLKQLMNNPINITSVIPIGMNRKKAKKLAQHIARTMRSMWSMEGGPVKLTPAQFSEVALNYRNAPEPKELMAKKIEIIFSERVIEKIIQSENHFISFTLNGEETIVNSKTPQPV